ncbi:Translational regulator CsrA [Neomoorella glycerini]|uniref:Translational regulator CsrA n=1 Tax=Neomoorella glycerini TaxID=55779 RepID=A0A6I5ZTV7_9FIRM|nr:carbon storage regulator CsrA [Moorella glycerini]QGP92811.1 Translational regulator CsrA [Moorella glycerini]
MLVLTRRVNETIVIGNKIKITVISIEEDKIRLGIDAPPDIPVVRQELLAAVRDENKAAARTPAVPVVSLPKKTPDF